MRLLFFTLVTFQLAFGSIHWMDNYDQAVKKAKKLHKPLFVFIERVDPPCHWCHLMKTKTLQDPKIAAYIDTHFVAVKLSKKHSNYPMKLYPRYVPTIYVLSPQGRLLDRIIGYWSVNDFWSDLRDVERKLKEH